MANVYLGLGTNLGDREKNLRTALGHIEKRIGEITSVSAFHETEPWGFASDNKFLNAVAGVSSALAPSGILDEIRNIEEEMGRKIKSNGTYADRIIDIDILLYNDLVVETGTLTIPHPLMAERDFVICPLAEIAPEITHPVLGEKIRQLAGKFSRSERELDKVYI